MKTKLGLTLGALLLASGIAVAAGGGWGDCGAAGAGYGMHRMQEDGRGSGPERMINYMGDELSLSDTQREQIRALMGDRSDPRESMRALRESHRALDPASPDYLDQVAKLAQEQAQQMAARMVEHAKVHAEIYAILTPEQQQRFSAMRDQHGGMGHHH